MKLHANQVSALNVFTGYATDSVTINLVKHSGSLIVMPQSIETWRPATFADLQADDFAALLAYQPEMVLLGTGSRLQFPHPRLTAPLLEAGIGVDAMDISAMCRTFNVLVGEDRRVLAAVLFD
ncbi:Mth938-like domain-containing protein [Burkholderiaceae bacterium DAT-1]|nr:Mth938-like domain-containing protein [Burkholderiaceae bacterium DAT-1]